MNSNKKVLVATYRSYSIFKIPKEFENLDDETIVEGYYVKWDILYIKPVGKDWVEIQETDTGSCNHECFKKPIETKIDKQEEWLGPDDDEDNDSEEDEEPTCCEKCWNPVEDDKIIRSSDESPYCADCWNRTVRHREEEAEKNSESEAE